MPEHLKDRSQYCIFHEDYKYTLATFRNLYFQLKAMMKRGELQKYVKKKVPIKPEALLPWKNQGQGEIEQAGTSKNGELGQHLKVVSFIHHGKDE